MVDVRHNWTEAEVTELLQTPLSDLVYRAQGLHRMYFDPNTVQLSTLLNIKTGGCPEDCAYCPQSARYQTGITAQPLMDVDSVKNAARKAKAQGATRFCMGAAWRSPRDRDLDHVIEMIAAVKSFGLETCATLGMLTKEQACRLKEEGLDFYNHNIDSSPEFYTGIISTRDFADRLQTLEAVRASGMRVCCGGIVGMGESTADRARMLMVLANLPQHPESVPINLLVRVAGTPLADRAPVDPFDMVRMIATARILMPASYIRLSAGRADMNDELQALCYLAGANSIFYGEKLLTTENPETAKDRELFARLGLRALQ
ncbi:MAG: biotin synthase BioB [Gammaproteobacteria bacterium]